MNSLRICVAELELALIPMLYSGKLHLFHQNQFYLMVLSLVSEQQGLQ